MMQDYRDWLGADSYEAVGSIGGSFASDNIEDYYVNPFELGYGFYIGWKKDFIGKEALVKMKDAEKPQEGHDRVEPRRPAQSRCVVVRGRHAVQVDRLPAAELCVDERGHADENGKMVGISMFNGYSFNERCMLSLAVVNDDVADRRPAHADLGRAADDG